MFHFYTPQKQQKTGSLFMFSGGIEVKLCFKMGSRKQNEKKTKQNKNKIMLRLKAKNAAKFYPGKINLTKAARPTFIQNSSTSPY